MPSLQQLDFGSAHEGEAVGIHLWGTSATLLEVAKELVAKPC